MLRSKRLSQIAILLLFIGIVGSFSTYRLLPKAETLLEEINVDDNNFKAIEISTGDGKVELLPTDKDHVLVEVSGFRLKENFSTTVKDDSLSITYKESNNKFYNFNFFQEAASIKVYLPQKTYHSISVQTNNGKLLANEINAEKMDLKANNGLITLENLLVDSLNVDANNGRITADTLTGRTFELTANDGSIRLKDITTDLITLASRNGKVELDKVMGNLVVQANNGSIQIMTDTLNHSIDLTSRNGKIHILTKEEPRDVEIEAQAKNGRITIFGENKTHAIFGSGKNKIDLSSNNGRIIVEEKK